MKRKLITICSILIIFNICIAVIVSASNEMQGTDNKNIKNLNDYRNYIKTLSYKNVYSVGKAQKKFKLLVTTDVEINNKMFTAFYEFYNKVMENNQFNEVELSLCRNKPEVLINYSIYNEKMINNYINSEKDKKLKNIYISLKNKSTAIRYNGFKIGLYYDSDLYSAKQIVANVKYLKKYFSPYVSLRINKFFNLLEIYKPNNIYGVLGEAHVIMPCKELIKSITEFENYVNKYPNYKETKLVNKWLHEYFYAYSGYGGYIADDVLKSYETFLQKNSSSRYAKYIKEIYKYTKNNDYDGLQKYYKQLVQEKVL